MSSSCFIQSSHPPSSSPSRRGKEKERGSVRRVAIRACASCPMDTEDEAGGKRNSLSSPAESLF